MTLPSRGTQVLDPITAWGCAARAAGEGPSWATLWQGVEVDVRVNLSSV